MPRAKSWTTLDVDRVGYGEVEPTAETLAIERDWAAPGVASVQRRRPLP